MTTDRADLKVGDRVQVEYEAIVTGIYKTGDECVPHAIQVTSNNGVNKYYTDPSVGFTKLSPELPTKVGSVIKSKGFQFFKTHAGWRGVLNDELWRTSVFEQSRFAEDFEIIYEPKE